MVHGVTIECCLSCANPDNQMVLPFKLFGGGVGLRFTTVHGSGR